MSPEEYQQHTPYGHKAEDQLIYRFQQHHSNLIGNNNRSFQGQTYNQFRNHYPPRQRPRTLAPKEIPKPELVGVDESMQPRAVNCVNRPRQNTGTGKPRNPKISK